MCLCSVYEIGGNRLVAIHVPGSLARGAKQADADLLLCWIMADEEPDTIETGEIESFGPSLC
jgi:hypothetical protein